MNLTSFLTMNYEQRTMNYEPKNKPNSNPIKAKTNPISEMAKMNVNSCFTMYYEQPTMNYELKNKPNLMLPSTSFRCDIVARFSHFLRIYPGNVTCLLLFYPIVYVKYNCGRTVPKTQIICNGGCSVETKSKITSHLFSISLRQNTSIFLNL